MEGINKGIDGIVPSDRYRDYLESVKDCNKYGEFPEMDHNPFVSKMAGQFSIKKKFVGEVNEVGSTQFVNEETGEVFDKVNLFARKKMVDEATFVKMFTGRLKDIFDLSKTAINVLLYIMDAIQLPVNINRDIIYLDVNDIMHWCGYGNNSPVYKGMTELIKAGMMAKSQMKNMYFIDPTVIFNGDRMVVMEEYIKKEKNYFNGDPAQGSRVLPPPVSRDSMLDGE